MRCRSEARARLRCRAAAARPCVQRCSPDHVAQLVAARVLDRAAFIILVLGDHEVRHRHAIHNVGAEGDVFPNTFCLGEHQVSTPPARVEGGQDVADLLLDAAPSFAMALLDGLPRQESAEHGRQDRVQQGRLGHVHHLSHVEDRRGAIIGRHPSLRLSDVGFLGHVAPEVVLASDEDEGDLLLRPIALRGLRQVHRTAAVDAHCRRHGAL
mmetsp:Transcript_30557/g.77823  ORF Transcript_30557/g.77823 Transcript_30557/m.77823 type:complete len:211 (+) Transcript_30557:598-1230(+)